MRDYGKVSPSFWTGETGRMLRGDANSQIVALYLMTSSHSNMIGVFHCPLIYISHDVGIPLEGASKALQRLSEVGFCEYDSPSEVVFVLRMASFQIGDSLKADDNRVKGLRKEVEKIAQPHFRERFLDIYGDAFSISDMKGLQRGSKGPTKPRARTGARAVAVAGTRNTSAGADTKFEEFWALYPNKTARKVCLTKWKARNLDSQADAIIANVKARIVSDGRWLDGFAPNPETFLNQDRWLDPIQGRRGAPIDETPDFLRGAI
jgi:hypothetical protein